jgi:glyoxylase-like metal-dependent hydrolase (beta-lactamase superfamily II)
VLSVLFTAGHASHHVAYWEPDLGLLFTGDVGGVRMPGSGYVLPPAPPPELAPDAWSVSVERMRQTGAQHLCLTHGGVFEDATVHLEEILPNLNAIEAICREAMLAGANDDQVTDLIQQQVEAEIGPEALAIPGMGERYGWASPSFLSALGFRRYLTKRGDVPAPSRPEG